MVIPKRIAWTSTEEFNLIFSNLFNSEGEIKSQLYALERVSIHLFLSNTYTIYTDTHLVLL